MEFYYLYTYKNYNCSQLQFTIYCEQERKYPQEILTNYKFV